MPLTRRLAVAAAILICGISPALADPPGLVGRLSYVEGPVSFHTGDQNQWVPATVNFPIIAGDALWTDSAARAEVQIGPAELRMDERTETDMLHVDTNGLQIRIDQGVVNLHLWAMPPGGVQVVTAPGEVDLLQPGTYHIEAGRPAGDGSPGRTAIAVLDGEARLVGPRTAVDLQPGEEAVISPDQSSLRLAEAEATPFDDWALARDRREAGSQSLQYLSPEMTGYQDLDQSGLWDNLPQYGPIWFPTTVAAGWAPYRYGRWAFVPPWGWTWVDDAPWGFTPFHYGRWVTVGGRWGWCPGHWVEQPVYAPAMVAFLGSPGGGIVAGGMPAVGWVPLGPGEIFHPYYRASPAYVRKVNIPHVTNTVRQTSSPNVPARKYINHAAATAVPTAAFVAARQVHHAMLPIAPQQLAQARVTADITRLRPTREARRGAPHGEQPAPKLPAPPSAAPYRPSAPGPQTRQLPPRPTVQRLQPEVRPPSPTQFRPMPERTFRGPPQRQSPMAQAPVRHPVQQTLPIPTPRGWVRLPRQPQGQPPHSAHPAAPAHPTGEQSRGAPGERR